MKNLNRLSKYIFFTCAILPVIVFCYGTDTDFYKTMPEGKLYNEARKIIESGHEHAHIPFIYNTGYIIPNIEVLTRYSSVILLGKIVDTKTTIDDNKEKIYRIHEVFVQYTIKGDVQSASLINMKMPGGAWLFNDGTSVSMTPFDTIPVVKGKTYILFLQKNKEDLYYTPSVDAQSFYEIDNDTLTVIPIILTLNNPMVIKYRNCPLEKFLEYIHDAMNYSAASGGVFVDYGKTNSASDGEVNH